MTEQEVLDEIEFEEEVEEEAPPEVETNAVTIYNFTPASNSELALALTGIKGQIEAAARANLNVVLEQDAGYTETEQLAMLKIESLRQVNGLDLAAILLRAEFLQEIQAGNFITIHPAGYGSLREMARDQGISEAELSQTLDLANVVFPYVQDVLHMEIPILWEQIGKSNMRELVPVLKRIITGEEAGAASVNAAADRILEDIILTFQATDEPELADDDELVHRTAVEQLLDQGMTLTNRELRHHIRPERTPSAEVVTFSTGDDSIVIAAELTADQWENFMRRLGQYVDPMPFAVSPDPVQRQREALRIRPLRRILDVVGGTNE